jgi:septal ring factor EnvC (AmiA/AmiB activator)
MLARQLKRVEGARSSSAGSLSRLRRENDALKNLLLELAADRQAAQSRLAELQERMAELASTSSMMGEVRRYSLHDAVFCESRYKPLVTTCLEGTSRTNLYCFIRVEMW